MKIRFLNKCNTAYGVVITILAAILGLYRCVFVGYPFCNVLDWLTGWYKAREPRRESSEAGLKGILKKLGYWVIVLVFFLMPRLFIGLGHGILGPNLDFLLLLGWFILACLLVDEIRSILENLVGCGCNASASLIEGLAITEKFTNAEAEKVN